MDIEWGILFYRGNLFEIWNWMRVLKMMKKIKGKLKKNVERR